MKIECDWLKRQAEFAQHIDTVTSVQCSADGSLLVTSSMDETIRLWQIETGKCVEVYNHQSGPILAIALLADDSSIIISSDDGTIELRSFPTFELIESFEWGDEIDQSVWEEAISDQFDDDEYPLAHFVERTLDPTVAVDQYLSTHKHFLTGLTTAPKSFSVHSSGMFLAAVDAIGDLVVWDVRTWESLIKIETGLLRDQVCAWIPNSHQLVVILDAGLLRIIDIHNQTDELSVFVAEGVELMSVAVANDGKDIAVGRSDSIIAIVDAESMTVRLLLEGHTSRIVHCQFVDDDHLISLTDGNKLGIWSVADMVLIQEIHLGDAIIAYPMFSMLPNGRDLVIWDKRDNPVVLYRVDLADLKSRAPVTSIVRFASAKVVLIGESNVGKTWLSIRLVENRVPVSAEQGTTHGMRIHRMPVVQRSELTDKTVEQRREIALWDMGGQDEYRLIHQLFLKNTVVALMLLDPTRGRASFQDMHQWNRYFQKQISDNTAVKLLVGAKQDQRYSGLDEVGINNLLRSCGFREYVETSALTGRGIEELRQAIHEAIDWETVGTTSRPELFQEIRETVESFRAQQTVVLPFDDLRRAVEERQGSSVDAKALRAVISQIAAQGSIAITSLNSGEEAVVLQIGAIELYAGSLILLARSNPRGIPVIEIERIASPDIMLPGLSDESRLPRLQERAVLECVVTMLIDHGICVLIDNMLIFPALLRPTEPTKGVQLPYSIYLYYDFGGAIDAIYSALVVQLTISERFGKMRLWENRVEYSSSLTGLCGLMRRDLDNGYSRLSLYFDNMSLSDRSLFTSFVERHLRGRGVDIMETIAVVCKCGFSFSDQTVKERIGAGQSDIGCPRCDFRTEISEVIYEKRDADTNLRKEIFALKTVIQSNRDMMLEEVKRPFKQSDESPSRMTGEASILHISDLHLTDEDDVSAILEPLIEDISGQKTGLGRSHIDYLVVTGDVTHMATQRSFENANQLVSGLIKEFDISSERCILVPGNHDVDWSMDVYDWSGRRPHDTERLSDGTYVEQERVIGRRNDRLYPKRFARFSSDFYHPIKQSEYPLNPSEQGIVSLFKDSGLMFLSFNSCWLIDEFYPNRSSINETSLARALKESREQISDSGCEDQSILKIALWHHPVTGNEKIVEDSFLELLQGHNVSLCLHGHVHENRESKIGYLHPTAGMFVSGVGTINAKPKSRPESMPRLYSVLDIAADRTFIRVNTRGRAKSGGGWSGFANWPDPENRNRKLCYYDIKLQ